MRTKPEVPSSRAVQMRRVLDEHKRSGQTLAAFARERDLNIATLHNWRRRFREDHERAGFLPIRIVNDAAPTSDGAQMLLEIGTDVRVRVQHGFDADELTRLVRTLRSC